MKLTLGMAARNNHSEVWHTIQALRLYQDLTDTEILVIDNGGDENLKNFIVNDTQFHHGRYVSYTEVGGPAGAKNKVFEEAQGDWVLCMDSHILLVPGAISQFRDWVTNHPHTQDLLQGPLLYNDLFTCADAFDDVWRGHMWGIWRNTLVDEDAEPYEIPMMGMGLFACRRDSWLGFNPQFRGFGGEEGYIHEKYRQAGRKTLCLPFLKWNHYFRPNGKGSPFPVTVEDRVRNYLIGFEELQLDITPIRTHFGETVVESILQNLHTERRPA